MKIVVTGGLGFIGSHFVNYVRENSDDGIVVVDKETYASNRCNLRHDVKILSKDICNVTSEDLGEYDYIVHFAAESHVDNSIENGLPFVRTNIEGTFNLLQLAKENKHLKKFFMISTDEVYGDMDDYEGYKIADEDFKMVGSSYYSASKISSDMLVLAAGRTYALPYLITRTCNNFGENQHNEKFIPKIIESIRNGRDVPVYGDGNQVREWIHADDNVRAVYKLLASSQINEIYNIGTGDLYTNNGLISMVGDILDKEINFKYVDDRLGHDRRYTLDSTKYVNKFGSIQNITLRDWMYEELRK